MKKKKIVLTHHWLMSMRGGERTLEAMAELFPEAPIYAIAGRRAELSAALQAREIHFSMLQHWPGSPEKFRRYLPFFPWAVSRIALPPCDLVLTSDANVIKGVGIPKGARHIVYCHTPARYLWDMEEFYTRRLTGVRALVRPFYGQTARHLRSYDRCMARRADAIIANSRSVAERIKTHYGRKADAVIAPPVDVVACHWDRPRTNTYLFVGELTAYKRADLAVEACTRLNLPLWVIGTGAEEARLRKRAGPTVEILGWRSDQEVRERMAQAKALLFPGEEDFGITPVEAMASGCPVIAYGKGGVLDTVVDRRSGVYFHEPAVESLAAALEQFEHGIKDLWSPGELRRHAEQFDRPIFQKKLREFLGKYLE